MPSGGCPRPPQSVAPSPSYTLGHCLPHRPDRQKLSTNPKPPRSHTCTHTPHLHAHTHTLDLHAQTHTRTHLHLHAHTHTPYTSTLTHTHTHLHPHAHTHTIPPRSHKRTHTHTNTHPFLSPSCHTRGPASLCSEPWPLRAPPGLLPRSHVHTHTTCFNTFHSQQKSHAPLCSSVPCSCSSRSTLLPEGSGPARGDQRVSEPKITSCSAWPAGASPHVTPGSPALCPTTCWTPRAPPPV